MAGVVAFCAAVSWCADSPDPKWAEESKQAIEKADPVMGDWQGTFTQRNKKTWPLVAQVVALGKGRYHATVLPAFDRRTTMIASLEGVTTGAAVRFMGWGDVSDYCGPDWDGVIAGGKFTGSVPSREGGTFMMEKVVRASPTVGVKPPAGALVLFDGTSFDQWETPAPRAKKAFPKKAVAGKQATEKASAEKPSAETVAPPKPGPVKWEIVDGFMRCAKGSGSIVTKKKFANFQMHLEFRTPFVPEAREQSRGNSGVLFHGLEIQVLDTYGLGGRSKECGGVYSRVAPLINMCAPPRQWQTYDVTIEAPKAGGNARLTVLHNGVKVHEGLDVGPMTGPSSIQLQDHSNPIEYRNIWLVELP
jgi:hypothetical protein